MKRRLLNLLTVLSLMLSVVVVAIWVATAVGYTNRDFRDYSIHWTSGQGNESTYHIVQYWLVIGRGEFVITRDHRTWSNPYPFHVQQLREEYGGPWPRDFHRGYASVWHGPDKTLWNRLGFRREHSVNVIESTDEAGNRVPLPKASRNVIGRGWRYSVPLWFLVCVTGAVPSARAVSGFRRRRRVTRGLCVHCGYDLRATPERCPECGTAASVSSLGRSDLSSMS